MAEFLISDLHLGHKNIVKFMRVDGQPLRAKSNDGYPSDLYESVAEHDAALIDAINSTCTQDDILWVLGDVAFSAEALEKVRLIRAHKRLVGGNHDHFSTQRYLDVGFEKVQGAVQHRGVILTHIPVHEREMGRFRLNVHGHLHNDRVQRKGWVPLGLIDQPGILDDERYMNVSVEQCEGMRPIHWDEVDMRLSAVEHGR